MFTNPFSFEGRIRRTEYGLSFIILAVGRVFLTMLLADVLAKGGAELIFFLFQLPLLWFFWAQGAKRCHDVGWNGWYQLIPFVPLYLIFASGQEYENEYGLNPKIKSETF